MLNFKEVLDKTVPQRKQIEEVLNKRTYHPEDANLYEGLKQADAYEIKQTLDKMSLAEVLVKAVTTDAAGAIYLVPTKVHDTLIFWTRQYDVCPLIGQVVDTWEGGDLGVKIAVDGSYTPKQFSSTGRIPDEEAKFVSANLSPESYGIRLSIGNDLIEDQKFGLIEWHIQQAAKAIGEQASDLAITILKTAPDGDGTLNSGTSGDADETRFTDGTTTDIVNATRENSRDKFVSDTLLTTGEAWGHSISTQAVEVGNGLIPPAIGYQAKIGLLDVLINNSPSLHASTDALEAAFTNCVSIVFSRNNSILTGRKRWLEMKNYSDPVNDLAGATVSYRQDTISLYKDAIYVLTET